MSAITHLPSPPLAPPHRVAPATVPPAPKKRAWKLWAGLALAAAGAWVVYGLLHKSPTRKAAGSTGAIRVARVATGSLQHVMRVTGTTSARKYSTISAPMMRGRDSGSGLILIYLAKSGSFVKKGAVIAQIDAGWMKDHTEDTKVNVESANGDIKKRKAEQAIDWENLQQTLRAAKADLDKAKLEASASETRTAIDAEMLKLAVEEAEAQYKQKQMDLPSKQAAFKAEIRVLELTRDRQKNHLERDLYNLDKYTIRAPMDGLAVMQSIWRGNEMGQVQQGDQVSPGQPFIKIVDLSGMQVGAGISQVSSDDIRVGQPAMIYFDAFPGLSLKGKVYSIGAIAAGGWRQNNYLRTVPLYISILGADDRVIPDLSTGADIILEQKDDALLVPLEAVTTAGGKTVVYVKNSGQYEPRVVKTGARSNTQVAVLEGVRAGEEVALDYDAVTARNALLAQN